MLTRPPRRRPPEGAAARPVRLATALAVFLWLSPAAAAEPRFNAVGPPLDAIAGKLADRRWLIAFLLDPARLQPGTAMPRSDLSRAEAADIAAYLYSLRASAGSRRRPPRAPKGDPGAGRSLFVERGCRGCHGLAPGERSLGPNLSAAGRKATPSWLEAWIRAPRAYNERTPMPAVPLSDGEIGDLVAYLCTLQSGAELLAEVDGAPAGNPRRGRELVAKHECSSCHRVGDLPPAAAAVAVPGAGVSGERALEVGRALVEWYRCRGCHVIEGQGGAIREHLAGETLAPPGLDGEGARVQPSWLARYLRRPSVLRSWLHIRMPDYGLGEAEAKALAAYFAALAGALPEDEPRRDASSQVIEAGRRHFEAYRCAQCHPAAGQGGDIPLDDRSIDLDLARERLRPSWIASFLARPTSVAGPQTRMPSVFFASDGSAIVADAPAEIDAVAAFLLHMDAAPVAEPKPKPSAVDWTTAEY